ncbi:MAG: class I SAM-dependent methyltransferase [Bacteroidota bacterium]
MSPINHFDTVAREWDKNLVHAKRTEAIAAALLQMAPMHYAMKALEFGAGTGLLSFALKDHLAEITLMDNSAEMIKVIEEKIAAAGIKNMHAVLFDLEKKSYKTKKFDIIYSQMALHHVHNIEDLFARFSNMLLPGGTIAIADLYLEDGTFHDGDFTGHRGFDPDKLFEIYMLSGLKNVSYKPCFVIEKTFADGTSKNFPVFLMTGQK